MLIGKNFGMTMKVKKNQKPDNNQPGGIIDKEMPMHISNLSFYDPSLKKPVPNDVSELVKGTTSVPNIPANICTGIAPTTSSKP